MTATTAALKIPIAPSVVEKTHEGIPIGRLKINSESLQPAKVHGHCLVAATVSNTPSRDDDVPL